VKDGKVAGYSSTLIPIFSDVITPDAEMAALIDEVRAPYEANCNEVIGRTDGALLYRRGNFNGTWDDLICDALMEERDAEIALSPGFRWGTSLLPGSGHHHRGSHNATSMTYPAAYRSEMTGRDAQGHPRRRLPTTCSTRSLLPAGRRHGSRRRHGLPDRRHKQHGQRISDMTLLKHRRGDRSGQDLCRRRLGIGQRRHRRPPRSGMWWKTTSRKRSAKAAGKQSGHREACRTIRQGGMIAVIS
jgi:hypothetical protein